MQKTRFALGCLLALTLSVARAETTGNELYAWLSSNDSSVSLRGYAYLDGVLDAEDFYLTYEIFSSLGDKASTSESFKIPHICFGNSKITFVQIRDIVFKYLEINPAKRHIRAHSLIRFALMEDFACAKNPPASNKK